MLQRQSIRHIGARLALLAACLQLALSLGHIHPWDIFAYGHPVAQGVGPAEIVADRHTTPVPLTPLANNAAADLACSICTNMALAGSLILADLVRLSPPSLSPLWLVDRGDPLSLIPSAFLLFQTRAPPLV